MPSAERWSSKQGELLMQCVDFYFDFISPYPWLASHQFGEVRECTAAKFRFVPVLFAALLDHHSNVGPAEIAAKRRYTYQDVQRWTAHLGLEFRAPPAHPFIPLKPLRVTSAIDDDTLREALAVRLLDATWGEEKILLRTTSFVRLPTTLALTGKNSWTRLRRLRSSKDCASKRRSPLRQEYSAFQALSLTARSSGETTGSIFLRIICWEIYPKRKSMTSSHDPARPTGL